MRGSLSGSSGKRSGAGATARATTVGTGGAGTRRVGVDRTRRGAAGAGIEGLGCPSTGAGTKTVSAGGVVVAGMRILSVERTARMRIIAMAPLTATRRYGSAGALDIAGRLC
jgi:hypothetical protein